MDVWAVGENGTILHWDGKRWSRVPSPTKAGLNDVFGTASADVWAVGEDGVILHWNGKTWALTTLPDAPVLNGVWAADARNAWVVGSSVIARWDGNRWSSVSGDIDADAVSGTSAEDVWAVGLNGNIRHWNGRDWSEPPGVTRERLTAAWTSSAGTVWAVGHEGVIVRHPSRH